MQLRALFIRGRHPLFFRWVLLSLAAGAGFFSGLQPLSAQEVEERIVLRIGAEPEAEASNALGQGICSGMRLMLRATGIFCTVQGVANSAEALRKILDGKIEAAIVQADVLAHFLNQALSGSKNRGAEALRSLMSVHERPFVVFARNAQGLRLRISDVKGGVVDVGPVLGNYYLAASWWRKASPYRFRQSFSATEERRTQAFCSGPSGVAAYVIEGSGPNASGARACGGAALDLANSTLAKLDKNEDFAYYRAIRPRLLALQGRRKSVKTFGVKMVLVSSVAVPGPLIFSATRLVFEELEELKKRHPDLGALSAKAMYESGAVAPFHRGAKNYYRNEFDKLDTR